MAEHHVFLALGSNLGDKEQNINAAYQKITERIGTITVRSAFYTTSPEGFDSSNDFVNSVCEVVCDMDAYSLFLSIECIEKELGRGRKSVNGIYRDRVIDIDLLMYDDLQIDRPCLIIPHPRLHLRTFVLDPFFEISPHTLHPVFGKTIAQLKDELSIRKEGGHVTD